MNAIIGILDYGAGNIKSVKNALDTLKVESRIINAEEDNLEGIDAVILPGVGSFSYIEKLSRIKKELLEKINNGMPFLGICLGLQWLFEKSEESIGEKGLGILKGEIKKFPKGLIVPQMGWNKINIIKKNELLKGLENKYFYFANSYFAVPKDKKCIAAISEYGIEFTSVIIQNNIYAVQFHPEKSGKDGLRLLSNFLKVNDPGLKPWACRRLSETYLGFRRKPFLGASPWMCTPPRFENLGFRAPRIVGDKMIIIPAIDIINGKCVRLTKGDFKGEIKVFGDPLEIAKKWEKEGAEYLHIIDLDGAEKGSLQNIEIVREIAKNTKFKIQLGGGIRTLEEMKNAFDSGVTRVIIGTRAIENLEFLKKAIEKFGSERIMVSVDIRNGKVYGKGWKNEYEKTAVEFLEELEKVKCKKILLTAIEKDGAMKGPDLELLKEIKKNTKMKIILAGGISSKEDIEEIRKLEFAEGIVIGKALYLGTIKLSEALK